MIDAEEHYAKCPQAKYHGKPFRYCPEKGCGWIEPQPAPQCMFMGCDSDEIDQRGPVVLRDGSKHYACTEHWEPIMRVIGQQRTWEQEAMRDSSSPRREV
jgi:hypothetical protein